MRLEQREGSCSVKGGVRARVRVRVRVRARVRVRVRVKVRCLQLASLAQLAARLLQLGAQPRRRLRLRLG